MKKLAFALIIALAPLMNSSLANAAPVNTTLPSISGVNQVDSTLRGNRGNWAGSVENYIYQWRRCIDPINAATCTAIIGQTSTSYKVAQADANKYIRFNVIAIDSSGATLSVLSNATAQIIAPPTNSSRPTISGSASIGSSLVTTNGTWSQPNQGIYRYSWLRCSSSQENSCSQIPNAVTNTYVVSDNDIGKSIRSEVRVFEITAKVFGSAISNSTNIISSIPKNLSSPFIQGAATTNEKLTLNLGSWAAYPEATYTQKWQKCSSTSAESCQDIAEQTTPNYTTQPGDLNSYFRAQVTGINNLGGTIKFTPIFGPILQQTLPVNTVQPAITGQAIEGSSLSLTNGTWTGLPAPTFSYKWFRCETPLSCVEIAGANQNTYTLTFNDGNYSIKASVIATNSLGSATSSSAPLAIAGALKAIIGPEIEGQIKVGSRLKVDTGSWLPAQEGSVYSYKWQVCTSKSPISCVDTFETTSSYSINRSDIGKYVRAGVSVTGKSSFVFSDFTSKVPGAVSSAKRGGSCNKLKAKAYAPKGNILVCKKVNGKLKWR